MEINGVLNITGYFGTIVGSYTNVEQRGIDFPKYCLRKRSWIYMSVILNLSRYFKWV